MEFLCTSMKSGFKTHESTISEVKKAQKRKEVKIDLNS
jgi:hypothetical protein